MQFENFPVIILWKMQMRREVSGFDNAIENELTIEMQNGIELRGNY